MLPKPCAWRKQTAPSSLKSRANQRKSSAYDSNNSCRRHDDSVHCCQNSRRAPLRGAPIHEAEQRHEEKRFRVRGDEKKRCRMREDEQCAANLERMRNFPAPPEQEEISPKTPGSELSCDQQRGARANVECTPKHRSDRRVRWEKRDIRELHPLVIDRRHNRVV